MDFCCSSSVSNFKDKFQKRFNLPEWHFLKSIFSDAIFFGMYNPVDYCRFMWHRGQKTIFWCGGDILNLQRRKWWQWVLRQFKTRHICENELEYWRLLFMGIKSEIQPCLIDRLDNIEISYKHSDKPNVYVCGHQGREEEYGINLVEEIADLTPDITYHIYGVTKEMWFYTGYLGASIDGQMMNVSRPINVIYHGKVSNEQFTEEIKNYQAGLRLNEFEGFSEVIAKSILMGQYPISRIKYPFIDYFKDKIELISLLNNLKNKKLPNIAGRNYWFQELNKEI